MTARKSCVNVATATYSGREMSPLHDGISAEGYDIDTIMEGFDKAMWIVRIKNNRKVWIRNVVKTKMIHEAHLIKDEYDTDVITPLPEEDDDISNKSDLKEKDKIDKIEIKDSNSKIKDNKVKKPTKYNLFLPYKLHILKEKYGKTKTSKEVYNEVVSEWKSIDKTSQEFNDIIMLAEEFKNIK